MPIMKVQRKFFMELILTKLTLKYQKSDFRKLKNYTFSKDQVSKEESYRSIGIKILFGF